MGIEVRGVCPYFEVYDMQRTSVFRGSAKPIRSEEK